MQRQRQMTIYHSKEKKMSRTPGAKDLKPRKKTVKKVLITSAEANLAEKLGVPLESYAKEKIKARKKSAE